MTGFRWLLLIVLLVAAWLARTLWLGGVFRTLEPHFAGRCSEVAGIPGPEDLTIHPRTGVAYVSACDRFALERGESPRGALYAFDEDGGRALAPVATLDGPVFDLAYDRDGGLWATSGGGELLELDPATFRVLNRYGDSLTQSLALDPASGKFYVSSGDGIERFDPVTRSFSHFSNVRVDDLAVARDGKLWGTSWPKRGDILTFDSKGRAQVQVRLDAPVDSIAFGREGTQLAGLLFASSKEKPATIGGANLYMVDVVTLRVVELARNGPGAEQLIATDDGRLLVANAHRVDVIAPLVAPKLCLRVLVLDASSRTL